MVFNIILILGLEFWLIYNEFHETIRFPVHIPDLIIYTKRDLHS